ncbi:MAG: hypothetical protein AB2693_21175 [Candidatus Thiodiazotropha sp.]
MTGPLHLSIQETNTFKRHNKTIDGVLSTIAQVQEDKLLQQLFLAKNTNLLKSIASSYESISSWGLQRQILSLLGQDFSYSELKEHIPSLSRYKLSDARRHSLKVGQGMPVESKPSPRTKIKDDNITHFMDFITSPAGMTDSHVHLN